MQLVQGFDQFARSLGAVSGGGVEAWVCNTP